MNRSEELREKVIELRALEDISQQKLADMTGVTKSKINQFETGDVREHAQFVSQYVMSF